MVGVQSEHARFQEDDVSVPNLHPSELERSRESHRERRRSRARPHEGGLLYSWGCSEKGRLGKLDEKEAEDNEQADDALKKRLLTRVASRFRKRTAAVLGSAFGGERGDSHRAGDFHSFAICANASADRNRTCTDGVCPTAINSACSTRILTCEVINR